MLPSSSTQQRTNGCKTAEIMRITFLDVTSVERTNYQIESWTSCQLKKKKDKELEKIIKHIITL